MIGYLIDFQFYGGRLIKKALLPLLLFVSTSLLSQTHEVCSNCKLKTLNGAIQFAAEGDTILVKKGTYKEYNIIVDKPLTIQGENYPIIDGEDKGEIIRIVSDKVTIDGFFIINVGTSYTSDYAAIRVVRSKDFLIQHIV
jgi:nitrous oxidase accessory protein